MYIYEVTKTKIAIEHKHEALLKAYDEADSKARAYYNETLLPAEEDATVSDEEMENIYNIYDDLCTTVDRLENQIDIAVNAIEALCEVETALSIAGAEGVWKEG